LIAPMHKKLLPELEPLTELEPLEALEPLAELAPLFELDALVDVVTSAPPSATTNVGAAQCTSSAPTKNPSTIEPVTY